MKSVLQHINDIQDFALREKCLANLDQTKVDLMCYSVGYALMLGVNQPSDEKVFWSDAYRSLNAGTNNSSFYKTD